MPIHEYECEKCGYRFEKLVLAVSDAPAECPGCRSNKLRKLISGAAFISEGSGSSCSSTSPKGFS